MPRFSLELNNFQIWLSNKKLNSEYEHSIISYLKRYAAKPISDHISLISVLNEAPEYARIPFRHFVNYLLENDKLTSNSAQRYLSVLHRKKPQPDMFVPSDEQVLKAYAHAIAMNFGRISHAKTAIISRWTIYRTTMNSG